MDIILYGTTEMSYLIASQLHQSHNVMVLCEEGSSVDKFTSLDIAVAEGSGGDIALLEQIGAEKADLFIACSALDEANIVACWTVKKVGSLETICFISKPALYKNFSSTAQTSHQTRYDIDSIIWPELLLTQDIFRIISVPDALDVEYLAGGKAKLFEYRIDPELAIVDKQICDCHFPKHVLIAGIFRDNTLFIPNGSSRIRSGDKVFFIGTGQGLDTLAVDFFQKKDEVKRVSIIGGGSVGFMLADRLERRNIRVKIIEQNAERCGWLADTLKKGLVLQGDGTDLELLESEGIAEADVCVCTTNNDEKNLLCSLLIRQLGTPRIITRVGNLQNYELFSHVGIDVVVSPKGSALTEVMNRLQTQHVDVVALIEGGKGEVLRLRLPETFKKVQIKDFPFPVNAVIGAVARGHKVIIPNGNTTLCPGDQLKVFTMKEDSEKLKELFFS